jgi:hypothetical protein
MSGRVYAVDPVGDDIDAKGMRAYDGYGNKIKYVTRVEFDGDTRDGMANVTFFACSESGQILVNPETNKPCPATIRTWVSLCERQDETPKSFNSDARFWVDSDGKVIIDRSYRDPVNKVGG